MINLEDLEIEYKYSSRRQSIGLMVTAAGKLVIAAPRGTPAADIARAVARHRDWIEAKATERQEAWAGLRRAPSIFWGGLTASAAVKKWSGAGDAQGGRKSGCGRKQEPPCGRP